MQTVDENSLLNALSKIDGTVLAVGDLMLDLFAYGASTRISPEAPIPVMRLTRETQMLGGVGNVARNIAALGGRTIVVAATGSDPAGDALTRLLESEPRIQGRLLRCPGRPTTTKQRFIVSGQQLLRVDREDTTYLNAEQEAVFISHIRTAMPNVSAVVLSDYGKGTLSANVLSATIRAAREAGKPVFVDPKNADMTRYAGATCITPNAGELAVSAGLPTETDQDVESAARVILASTGAAFVLVTRSADGMSLVCDKAPAFHLRARSRDVFDVSGAGDTVIGALALAIASGIDWHSAVTIANIAAGVVVGKSGTATCSLSEVELDVFDQMLGLGAKLQLRSGVERLSFHWREKGLRVGFTNGCFDLLHPGHIALLRRAREHCDRLIVGLNSDSSVTRLKGHSRPLQNQVARATVLAALACVDAVVIFDEDKPLDLIAQLRPSVLVKGADYTIETIVGADLVLGYGGDVKVVELVEGQSTTSIINRMP